MSKKAKPKDVLSPEYIMHEWRIGRSMATLTAQVWECLKERRREQGDAYRNQRAAWKEARAAAKAKGEAFVPADKRIVVGPRVTKFQAEAIVTKVIYDDWMEDLRNKKGRVK